MNLEWKKNRLFAALNYRLHTDAVKEMLPADIDSKLSGIQYAREAEMLNLAVFGFTAKDWKQRNLILMEIHEIMLQLHNC